MSKGEKKKLELATTKDRLSAHFGGSITTEELQTKEKELASRVASIWSILSNKDDIVTTTEAINKHILINNGELSISSAYRDLRMATQIFGDLGKISKQAMWFVQNERATQVLKLAIAAKDLGQCNKAIKNINEIIKEMPGDDNFNDEKTGMYVMEVYVNDNEKPRTFNLDNSLNIKDVDFEELKESVDSASISEVEIRKKIEDASGNKKA